MANDYSRWDRPGIPTAAEPSPRAATCNDCLQLRQRAEQAEADAHIHKAAWEAAEQNCADLTAQNAAMQAAIVEAEIALREVEWCNNSKWQSDRARHALTKLAPFIPQGPDMPTDGHHPAEGFQQIADYIAPAIQAQT